MAGQNPGQMTRKARQAKRHQLAKLILDQARDDRRRRIRPRLGRLVGRIDPDLDPREIPDASPGPWILLEGRSHEWTSVADPDSPCPTCHGLIAGDGTRTLCLHCLAAGTDGLVDYHGHTREPNPRCPYLEQPKYVRGPLRGGTG